MGLGAVVVGPALGDLAGLAVGPTLRDLVGLAEQNALKVGAFVVFSTVGVVVGWAVVKPVHPVLFGLNDIKVQLGETLI